jgi:hypothetical protein
MAEILAAGRKNKNKMNFDTIINQFKIKKKGGGAKGFHI